MPTDQPSNAPDTLPTDARDPATPGAVLNDTEQDKTPGGGGLGGATAARPESGSGAIPSGTTPGSPIDVPVPDAASDDDGAPASAGAQSRREAAGADPVELRPSSI